MELLILLMLVYVMIMVSVVTDKVIFWASGSGGGISVYTRICVGGSGGHDINHDDSNEGCV